MHAIRLRGARTHNLRGVDLDLAPGELCALTGPSGAGKSSLALDTLYAEGQRRFVESFSPYARQFLERLERPPIDALDPVAATVAVDRRAPIRSSRSTLATLADLEPYLAGLFAREATPRCAGCGVDAVDRSAASAAEAVVAELAGQRVVLSYPVRARDAEEYLALRETLLRDGYGKLVVGGAVRALDDVRPSEATAGGAAIEVVLDRLRVGPDAQRRVQHAVEVAHERAGRAELRVAGGNDGALAGRRTLARGLACPSCGRTFEPPRPALFSYNSPVGACAGCRGFGRTIAVDWDKVIPDGERTLAGGVIRAWSGTSAQRERAALVGYCKRRRIPMDAPWRSLGEAQRAAVIEGEEDWREGRFPGVRRWFRWLEQRTYKMHVRVFLARYREYLPCAACGGARLNENALGYRVGQLDLAAWHALTVDAARERLSALAPSDPQARRIREELLARLGYLAAVGLGYLTLERQARTLSGGEAQRAGLTTALSATLTGALFVLDEPTVGLHAADVPALARVMRDLASAGNTVLVVEHDAAVVQACDRVIELGPGAGDLGGRVLFDGPPAGLAARPDLATGAAWARGRVAPAARRTPTAFLSIAGVTAHNLAAVDVRIPLGVVCAVTGPSGSGKSTLCDEVIYRAVARALGNDAAARPGPHGKIEGVHHLRAATLVDQAPLGRTARGNPATYTHAWDRIRARFAAEPSAIAAGLTASHFSFNSTGRAGSGAGRCEACAGEGYETVEMQFLADVSLLCAVCQGRRFRPEVLAVRHGGLSVAEVLALTVDAALERLGAPAAPGGRADAALVRALAPVAEVGLGYLPLGQPLSTLSGGEAQRLKLARALAERPAGTLFVIDEPSAGLHALDARRVIAALSALCDRGASVLLVDHDLEVIAAADHVIDLGPGAGPGGGHVVALGTPDEVARSGTRTGEALRRHLDGGAPAGDGARRPIDPRRPPPDAIRVSGAREHNLRDVSCAIPHGALCVVTGPSGSGKSSLAFDVVFAEGQRRYMETLTPYARQFLPALPRPEVDRVDGVPPSIALEQRGARGGGASNSTVATVTEVAHYLRLLYARIGQPHCPDCDEPVSTVGADALFSRLTSPGPRGRHTVYAPAVRGRKGSYLDLFAAAARAGIVSARVDGALGPVDPPPRLARSREHTIDLVVYSGPLQQLARADFERALALGAGAVRVARGGPSGTPAAGEALHSTRRGCARCGGSVPELDPRWFSFNTRQGQCAACEGRGSEPGDAEEGVTLPPCRACGGTRLDVVPRRVRLLGETYPAFLARDVDAALAAARAFRFDGNQAAIARAPHAELLRRLQFAADVGLGYLALDRPAGTLSGGEMQRLRLSAQLGSGLTGALYVLDEPTIGLHPRDTRRLLANLRALVDTGSTVLVVEHDADTIRAADHLIDLGPGGGRGGGRVVAAGRAAAVLADPASPTGRALAEPRRERARARPPATAWITLRGARANNLKDVDFAVPVGRLSVVAGVSGSGKSTLVRQVFHPALRRALDRVAPVPGGYRDLRLPPGSVARALAVDQSPIGRTPRSVPATFLGVWDEVRRLYAGLPEARARGHSAARFSFNGRGGGRCPQCEGQGTIVAAMSFLPDVVSPCEACGGARFEPATLDVRYAGLSIGDVLRLTAAEAARVFAAHPKIARPLAMLEELGVGYLALGQGSHTLSGGEAQRLKLAAEVTAGTKHEPTCYVLDEPTTGLHLTDVRRLIGVFDHLVERGDTLVVIEHHPDVILAADRVVELGPDGGAGGGRIVFQGSPAELRGAATATGRCLSAG